MVKFARDRKFHDEVDRRVLAYFESTGRSQKADAAMVRKTGVLLAWLHIVCGQVALASIELNAGDGVGLRAERSVSFTAREASEVLLLDVAGRRAAQRSSSFGGAS